MNQVLYGWTTPPTAARLLGCLLRLRPDDFAAYHEIMNLLEDDPDLRRLIISLAADRGLHVSSVARAFQRLGPERLLRLTSTRLLVDCAGEETFLGLHPDMWIDGVVANAAWAELLARACGYDPQKAYVLGMLHRLGQAALGRFLLKVKPTVGQPPLGEAAAILWERAEVGIDSIQTSYLMVQAWGIDDTLSIPIRMQQHPLLSVDHRVAAAILRVTRGLSYRITGWSEPIYGVAHLRELMKTIGISEATVDQLVGEAREHYLGLREYLPHGLRAEPLLQHA